METRTITNPKTGREVKVRAWRVEPRVVLAKLRSGEWSTARDISWGLLADPQAACLIERTDGGDSAENNFALNIFENALDWSLGLKVLTFIQACQRIGKMPKPFDVLATRQGHVFIATATGRVLG